MTGALLLLVGTLAAQAAPCEVPSQPAALSAATREAQHAFETLDLTAFEASEHDLEAALACLDQPADGALASDVYLVLGLSAYLAQPPDDDLVINYFRSAISASSDTDLPDAIAPQGNPLRKLFDRARAAPPATQEPVASPPSTTLMIEGKTAEHRPTDRPILVQLTTHDTVLWTGIIAAGQPLPDWESLDLALPASAPEPPPAPTVQTVHKGPKTGLLVLGGASLVAAGGMYGVAYGWSQDYDNPDNPDVTNRDDLDSLRSRTNTMVWASTGALGVGLALTTGAFLNGTALDGAFIDAGTSSVKLGWRTTW